MKYAKYILTALVLLFALTAVGMEPKKISKSDYLLDTYVTITVYGRHEEAIEQALLRTREIDRMCSAFRADSEISKINQAPCGTAVPVSEDCFFLLKKAKNLAEVTEGAFDFTVKPLMDLWGFGSALPAVPDENALAETTKLVGYQNVILDENAKTVTLLQEGTAIDLGGIAKGYAADEALRVLKEHGVTSAYLDFGGNVLTLGQRPFGLWEAIGKGKTGCPFLIGIQDPTQPRGTMLTSVEATQDCFSVVTSGGYERNFTEDGKLYHHILDPKTGMQPQNGVLSVTVMGSVSADCDALSTALFVAGPQGAAALSDWYTEVLFVMEDGSLIQFP